MAINNERTNDEFSFEIVEHIADLKEYPNGWTKEVNIVAWNHAEPKVDIRDWDPEHKFMSRGVTLTKEESETLARAIGQRMLDQVKTDKVAEFDER